MCSVVMSWMRCVPVLDSSPILPTFQVILLEHIIMCRLVTGHKATALQEVGGPTVCCLIGPEVKALLVDFSDPLNQNKLTSS